MTFALILAIFAGGCGFSVSDGPRATGDTFTASAEQRRLGRVLALVAGLLALMLVGTHPQRMVACVALLWSIGLCGPLLCCMRWLGAPKVLSIGAGSLLGALVGAMLS